MLESLQLYMKFFAMANYSLTCTPTQSMVSGICQGAHVKQLKQENKVT